MKIKLLFIIIVFLVIGAGYLYLTKSTPVAKESTPKSIEEKQLDSQGLEWTDDIPGINGHMDWITAQSYCVDLSADAGLKPNVPWRLPTKNELLKLYREAQSNISITSLNSVGYWSSEEIDSQNAIVVNGNLVNTAEGYLFSTKNSFFNARCVR